MADTGTTAAPAKKRKAQGPRQAKPLFAVIKYTDDQGQAVVLDKSRLSISVERDAGKLLELVTGEGVGPATVMKIELPQPQRRNTEAGAATA